MQSAQEFALSRADLIAGPGLGSHRRRALSDFTDEWLVHLFRASGAAELGCALVAVGGYGRRQLAPHSDIDVLLLHPAHMGTDEVRAVADSIWYPIWDCGLRLDHSVRTPADTRRLAGQDLRVMLGLLDARTVVGDDRLMSRTRSSVLGDWRATAPQRLDVLLADALERRRVHGELAYLLEPDLKQSAGGLRDVTALRAVAASWVINPPGVAWSTAASTLLDVRDALHIVAERATDRLRQQDQPEVAQLLGYADPDNLLRAVCAAGRTVSFAASATWARLKSHVRSTSIPRRRRISAGSGRTPLAEGVVVQAGEVVLAADARPDRDPVLVLRAAAAAAQAGLPLSVYTVNRLAGESSAMPVPWPRQARESLVSLLGAGRRTLPVWESLDQAGLIERLIPGWDVVRSAPQRNPVHCYTVDRHLVQTATMASEHIRKVARPDLLLVGALLHDIGKARGGDHTQIGVEIVGELAPRLGFDADDSRLLVQMVRQHLLLPQAATRLDIDDPATIANIAAEVGTLEELELLHHLTLADAAATGPAAWSPWKANLVHLLVQRVQVLLSGQPLQIEPVLDKVPETIWSGSGTQVHVAPGTESDVVVTVAAPDCVGLLSRCVGALSINRLSVRQAASVTVDGRAVLRFVVQTQFGEPPAVDRLTSDVRRALNGQADLAGRLAERERAYDSGDEEPPPVVALVPGASSRATVLEVRAHDRVGLLHRLTSALADAGFTVDRANVATLGSEVVDVFFLVADDAGPLPEQRARAAVAVVEAALSP